MCEHNRWNTLKWNHYTTCTALPVVNISTICTSFSGDVSVAQLVVSMSGIVPELY